MSDPSLRVQCSRHGQRHATYLCGHLVGRIAQGFFPSEPRPDEPRPDAWCRRCEEVLKSEGAWNDRSEAFAAIKMVCDQCYDEIRARNVDGKPDPAAAANFVCATCSERHEGLPMDFAFGAPLQYAALNATDRAAARLDSDRCQIENDYFVRVCLEIPIRGGEGPFVFGVWTSLSEKSFARYNELAAEPSRYSEPPFFGWLCSRLPLYPETLFLKAHVHLRPPPLRPVLELEPTDHPLAVAQRDGISIDEANQLSSRLLHLDA